MRSLGWKLSVAAATLATLLCLTADAAQGAPVPREVPESGSEGAINYRLEGSFHNPDGTPYTDVIGMFLLRLDPFPNTPDRQPVTVFEGQFDLDLPAGLYSIVLEPEPLPFHMPRTKVDLRQDITGLVITLVEDRVPPLGHVPPDASRVTVSGPDAEGYASVTGAAGAVPPYSAVEIANRSAGNLAMVAADADGAFAVPRFYAPPGSAILVKYDLDGDIVAYVWQVATGPDVNLNNITPLVLLPGTMVPVGDPQPRSGATQPFTVVGAWWELTPKAWAGWWLSGTLQVPAQHASDPWLGAIPGEVFTVTAELRMTSPGMGCTGSPTYTAHVNLELLQAFGEDGRANPWGMAFEAHLFTPTGLPINRSGYGKSIHLGGHLVESWTCVSANTLEGAFSASFTIPVSLTAGTYVPRVRIQESDIPLASTEAILPVEDIHLQAASMPPLRIGEPEPPRIPWSLLANETLNGHRGVQAREDVGHYQLYPWVVFPPETVVIPRMDTRSGEPIAYRLEPGASWLSATDRNLPNAPLLPIALPSGELTVEVRKPDGTADVLGPAPVLQSWVQTPATPGGNQINERSGYLGDVFHLSTMSDQFAHVFRQFGLHTIVVNGWVADVYGNTYAVLGTYDVHVAQVLDLDPAQLPTTPFVQGDAFAPGLHVFPPVPAEVIMRLVQMPYSDPERATETIITGGTNRFGYFQPAAGTVITMSQPGEFRVDFTAVYAAPDDVLWMGSMTWGNVIEGPAPMMEAHGRRGMDYKDTTIDDMPAWFIAPDLPPNKIGNEVFYPYFSGDIHWGGVREGHQGEPGDSIQPMITIRDLGATGPDSGPIYDVLKANIARYGGQLRPPPPETESTYTALLKRMAIGEAPLFMTTRTGVSPHAEPEEIDQWGYWYGTSQRPDVRVKELLSEDMSAVSYWGFDDTYGYQIGEAADGDQPGDLKWEFGGAVLRTISETNPLNEYAIYSSLWVLIPDDDALGTRVTPPFRGANGTSIDGGPILTMTVEGEVQEIDVLFLPKGLRPGDVLRVGDVIGFSGHVGPPLDSRVQVTATAPSGLEHAATFRANKIGWVYDPAFDFVVEEPGRWTVDVLVVHDRPLAYAAAPTHHNSGTVMGTTGRFEFYVVEPESPALFIASPQPGWLVWPMEEIEPIVIQGRAPAGTTDVHYTIHDKGVVMGQGVVNPEFDGTFTLVYDAEALQKNFSMLSLTAREGRWEGLADEVSIRLLAVGSETPRAATVTLIGEEVFVESGEDPGGGFRVYLPVVIRE